VDLEAARSIVRDQREKARIGVLTDALLRARRFGVRILDDLQALVGLPRVTGCEPLALQSGRFGNRRHHAHRNAA